MVKIAVAGGTGNVAQEIIDGLVAAKKHDILILSRRGPAADLEPQENISYAKTDYSSVEDLTIMLGGIHTVLSFVAPHLDQEEAFLAQKNLINASIKAGVKRFAPSEWVSAGIEHMPWYSFKAQTRQYLQRINKDSKVLEYCLFQPGLFTNYLTHPYKSMTHIKHIETPFDFGSRRMIVCDGGEDQKITFTTVRDLANIVAQAVEYTGEWPVVGGIIGSNVTVSELIALGEELRGLFVITRVEASLLQAGTWSSSWVPKIDHPSIAPEHLETASRTVTAGILLAVQAGDFESNDAWNTLLPNYKFEQAEDFLEEAWHGKP